MPTRFKVCPFNTETWHKGLTSLSQPHIHNLTHRILLEIARVSVSHLPGTGEPPNMLLFMLSSNHDRVPPGPVLASVRGTGDVGFCQVDKAHVPTKRWRLSSRCND